MTFWDERHRPTREQKNKYAERSVLRRNKKLQLEEDMRRRKAMRKSQEK